MTRSDFALTNEDIAEVWEQIEAHDETEKEVVTIAKNLRDSAWSPVHKALLDYLVTDEEKHDKILNELGEIKTALSRATT